MKFDCGETVQEYIERTSNWHKHFCLFPVRIGPHDCRWLEYVERRCTYYPLHDTVVEYRAIERK